MASNRGIGRVLCFLGWHRWGMRSVREQGLLVTYNHCEREGCPRYADEFIVEIEAYPLLCKCRRYGFPSPLCEIHGKAHAA